MWDMHVFYYSTSEKLFYFRWNKCNKIDSVRSGIGQTLYGKIYYFDELLIFVDPNKLEDIKLGDKIQIKKHNGELLDIIVTEILTKIPYHHLGIKVKGSNGEIGRAQIIYPRVSEMNKINQLISEFTQNLNNKESETLEFKSGMLFDLKYYKKTNKKKIFEKGTYSIAKTIAAFANQHGGVLYIGVIDDTKEIFGLNEDYELLTYKKNSDGFLLKLKSSMEKILGKADYHQSVTERRVLEVEGNKEICVIKVKPSRTPLIVTWEQQPRLYVREGDDSIHYENIQAFCNHWYEHMKELES